MRAEVAEIKRERRECREHCEKVSGDVAARIGDLEKQEIVSRATAEMMQRLDSRERERQDLVAQDNQAQWIKWGAVITMLVIAKDVILHFLSKYF